MYFLTIVLKSHAEINKELITFAKVILFSRMQLFFLPTDRTVGLSLVHEELGKKHTEVSKAFTL